MNYFILYADHLVVELSNDWHQARISLGEMIHFIRQLQAYCQLEVIECSWKVLEEFVSRREGDLDALIGAHRTYLERLVNKALLLGPKGTRVKEVSASAGDHLSRD